MKMDNKIIKLSKQEETLEIEKSNAIILHPSLGCPVIAEPGKPISIFLLTDQNFFDIFSKEFGSSPKAGGKGGGAIKRHINQMLKFTKWDDQKDFLAGTEDKIKPLFENSSGNANSNNDSGQEGSEQQDTAKTKQVSPEESIDVTFLGKQTSQNGVINKQGKVFANIRKSVLKRYKESFDLSFAFQVDISNLNIEEKKVYEFSWITPNDEPFCKPENDAITGPHDEQKYYSTQGQDTREFITNTPDYESRKQFTHAYKIEEEGDFKFEFDPEVPIINHHPVWVAPKDKSMLNIGHLSDPHISVRQHAFKTCKAQVIPGATEEESPKIGDLVNASFYTFKDLMDQLVDEQNADILVITGDLIDHDINYNPKSKFIDNSDAKTGDIWEAMTLDNIGEKFDEGDDAGKEMYPSSIDSVVIYSLIHRFYTKYNKPIFIISGNHENYKYPYGISPRLKTGRTLWNNIADHRLNKKSESEVLKLSNSYRKEDWQKKAKGEDDGLADAKKANDGIPADHNLTIYEATLMYGPDYSTIPMAGTGKGSSYTNFRSETSDWFYQIFTPLTDFYFNYKGQTFIGLEWGDEEKILTNVSDAQVDYSESTVLLGGVLPRANKSISGSQREIIENAINEENTCNILMTHYTYTAYFPEKPHSEIGITNIIGKYEFGTFQENKDYVYKDLIQNNKIQYTLSGHTHRAGLYQLNDGSGKSGWLSNFANAFNKGSGWGSLTPGDELYVKSIDLLESANNSEQSTTKKSGEQAKSSSGNSSDSNSSYIYTGINQEKTKMLVTSCAGPTGKQNFDNELFGLGTDYPSGAYIKYSDENETVGIVRSKVDTAKPRFAVALEFADLVGREKLGKDYGIFKRIKLSEDGSTLDIKINDELKIPMQENGSLNKVTLFINSPIGEYKYSYKSKHKTSNNESLEVYDADIDDVEMEFKTKINKSELKEAMVYSSILFRESHEPAFKHYDYSKPLTIKSEMRNIKDVLREEYNSIIMRVSNPDIRQNIEQEMQQAINSNSGYLIDRDPVEGEVINHYKLSESNSDEFEFDWSKRVNETPPE